MNAFADAAVILLLLGVALGAPGAAIGADAAFDAGGWFAGPGLAAAPAACWLAVVTPALVRSDREQRRLPNVLTLPALGLVVAGAGAAWAGRGGRDPAIALGVVGASLLVGVIGAGLGGVGLGDVKLGAALAGSAGLLAFDSLPVMAGVTAFSGCVAASTAWWTGRPRRSCSWTGGRWRRWRLGRWGRRRRSTARRGSVSWKALASLVERTSLGRVGVGGGARRDSALEGVGGVQHRRVAPRCERPHASRLQTARWPGFPYSYEPEPWWPDESGAYSRDVYESLVAWETVSPRFPGRADLDRWRSWQEADARADEAAHARFAGGVWPGEAEGAGSRERFSSRGRRVTIAYGPCLLAGYWCGLLVVQLPGLPWA